MATFDLTAAVQDFEAGRARGEFFPADWSVQPDGTTFLDYFQRDRTGQPKGIIAIDLGGLP